MRFNLRKLMYVEVRTTDTCRFSFGKRLLFAQTLCAALSWRKGDGAVPRRISVYSAERTLTTEARFVSFGEN